MSVCAPFDPGGAYATQVVALGDCHAQAMAQQGWLALAGAGGALTGLLTIFLALIGYRLMLGRGPSLAEGAGWLGRLALVLVLVTQASAYQALVRDVVLAGPQTLASAIAAAAGLGPVQATAQAAQVDALAAQAAAILSFPDTVAAPVRPALRPALPAAPSLPSMVRAPLHAASLLLMVTMLAGWLCTRLVAGALLGLGPVLASGLLFEGTRGLALGWIRGLAGAALGQVAAALVLAMELPLAKRQMAGLIAALDAGAATGAMADALLATTLVFAAVMLAGLVGMARVGAGVNWPLAWRPALAPAPLRQDPPVPVPPLALRATHVADRRVERIAAATQALDRRMANRATLTTDQRIVMGTAAPAAQARDGDVTPVIRLGQGGRRGARLSRQARQRDARA